MELATHLIVSVGALVTALATLFKVLQVKTVVNSNLHAVQDEARQLRADVQQLRDLLAETRVVATDTARKGPTP
jgi:hypothetical protein